MTIHCAAAERGVLVKKFSSVYPRPPDIPVGRPDKVCHLNASQLLKFVGVIGSE